MGQGRPPASGSFRGAGVPTSPGSALLSRLNGNCRKCGCWADSDLPPAAPLYFPQATYFLSWSWGPPSSLEYGRTHPYLEEAVRASHLPYLLMTPGVTGQCPLQGSPRRVGVLRARQGSHTHRGLPVVRSVGQSLLRHLCGHAQDRAARWAFYGSSHSAPAVSRRAGVLRRAWAPAGAD